MSDTIVLRDVSFRVVGTFMRVNQPYTAVPSPTGIPFSITLPEIEVAQPPTVGALMDALQPLLASYVDPATGTPTPLTFEFSDLPAPAPPGTLDLIAFGLANQDPYKLSASDVSSAIGSSFKGPNGEKLGVAWQYYVFNKDETGRDERIEVSGRSRYRDSVMVRDNSRIIWRLITTYLNPIENGRKQDVKRNRVAV